MRKFLLAELKVACGLANDDLRRGGEDALFQHVLDCALDGVDGDDLVEDLLVGGELLDRTLEPSDVGGDVIGDVNSRRGRLEGMEDHQVILKSFTALFHYLKCSVMQPT